MKMVTLSLLLPGFFALAEPSRTSLMRRAGLDQETREYLNICEKNQVSVPKTMDCSAGKEIPINRTHCVNGTAGTREEITSNNFDQKMAEAKTCDNPAWLHFGARDIEKACVPGSRIQTIVAENGTQCVLLCRKYKNDPSNSNDYEDINLICNQPKNGATCFFNSPLYSGVETKFSGKTLQAPGSDPRWTPIRDVERMECTKCHNADPFIVSPYVADLKIVPGGESKFSLDRFGPYYAVNRPKGRSLIPGSSLVSPEAKSCTSCHRIGSSPESCQWTEFASSMDQTQRHKAQTVCGKTASLYMPPANPPKHQLGKKEADALKFILECCSGKKDCEWEPLPGKQDSGLTKHIPRNNDASGTEEETH